MEKRYTVSVFCENRIGILNRVSIIFARRRINIENFIGSETEIKNVYRMAIVVQSTREVLEKVVQQIEKQIEILRAFVHEEEDIISKELALYKISTKSLENGSVEHLVKENNVQIISMTSDYIVIQKTGTYAQTQQLLEKLEKYDVMEFARSGSVVILKWSKRFHQHLKEFDQTGAVSI